MLLSDITSKLGILQVEYKREDRRLCTHYFMQYKYIFCTPAIIFNTITLHVRPLIGLDLFGLSHQSVLSDMVVWGKEQICVKLYIQISDFTVAV